LKGEPAYALSEGGRGLRKRSPEATQIKINREMSPAKKEIILPDRT